AVAHMEGKALHVQDADTRWFCVGPRGYGKRRSFPYACNGAAGCRASTAATAYHGYPDTTFQSRTSTIKPVRESVQGGSVVCKSPERHLDPHSLPGGDTGRNDCEPRSNQVGRDMCHHRPISAPAKMCRPGCWKSHGHDGGSRAGSLAKPSHPLSPGEGRHTGRTYRLS